MRHTLIKKFAYAAVAVCMAVSSMPVFADDPKPITVEFEDVTATDTTTQYGEAKIKVRISGASGNTTVVQNAFTFDGLRYKSTRFLKGENNPPAGVWYAPTDIAAVNADQKFTLGIASEGLAFGEREEVYIITFSGEPGEMVTLNVSDETDKTYCVTDGQKITAAAQESGTAVASAKGNQSAEAVVRLTMDRVPGFNAAADTGITLKITSETTPGYVMTNTLSNKPVQENGHRENTDIPTFTVRNSILGGDTYTVELFGAGYVSYRRTGVTFDEALSITNADLIPGDVNGDGIVDAADKTAAEKSRDEEFNEAADFDRNGKTDAEDMKVFNGISDTAAPAKMAAPTVTGGSKTIHVAWSKPSDNSVTGYTVKYGTNRDQLTGTKEIGQADTVSTDIAGLLTNTTYYVQIAARNGGGTGAFSDIVSTKTAADSSQDGTGGGGGGGSAGGIGGGGSTGGSSGGSTGGGLSPAAPGETANPDGTATQNGETFTDLADFAWAKDAIYALKKRGIISGVSDTEFAPASNIKRGDFILILTRMLSINDAFTENFADVPADAYYYQAIGSARAAGIAQGSGENFMPEDSITRQDLITLAYRAFLAKGYLTETDDLAVLDAFADRGEIADYAQTAMASMVKTGIIQGADGKVNPKGSATRAEVAVMCERLAAKMDSDN